MRYPLARPLLVLAAALAALPAAAAVYPICNCSDAEWFYMVLPGSKGTVQVRSTEDLQEEPLAILEADAPPYGQNLPKNQRHFLQFGPPGEAYDVRLTLHCRRRDGTISFARLAAKHASPIVVQEAPTKDPWCVYAAGSKPRIIIRNASSTQVADGKAGNLATAPASAAAGADPVPGAPAASRATVLDFLTDVNRRVVAAPSRPVPKAAPAAGERENKGGQEPGHGRPAADRHNRIDLRNFFRGGWYLIPLGDSDGTVTYEGASARGRIVKAGDCLRIPGHDQSGRLVFSPNLGKNKYKIFIWMKSGADVSLLVARTGQPVQVFQGPAAREHTRVAFSSDPATTRLDLAPAGNAARKPESRLHGIHAVHNHTREPWRLEILECIRGEVAALAGDQVTLLKDKDHRIAIPPGQTANLVIVHPKDRRGDYLVQMQLTSGSRSAQVLALQGLFMQEVSSASGGAAPVTIGTSGQSIHIGTRKATGGTVPAPQVAGGRNERPADSGSGRMGEDPVPLESQGGNAAQ